MRLDGTGGENGETNTRQKTGNPAGRSSSSKGVEGVQDDDDEVSNNVYAYPILSFAFLDE